MNFKSKNNLFASFITIVIKKTKTKQKWGIKNIVENILVWLVRSIEERLASH